MKKLELSPMFHYVTAQSLDLYLSSRMLEAKRTLENEQYALLQQSVSTSSLADLCLSYMSS